MPPWLNWLGQGHLTLWMDDSTLILLNLGAHEILIPKLQQLCNYERNNFLPYLESVAQNLGQPHPFEVFQVFGGKSKVLALRPFQFVRKQD